MYVFLASIVLALPPQDGLAAEAQARAAIALASAQVDSFVQAKPKLSKRDYAACYYESLRTGKPLIVWNGYKCVSSEAQLPDAIHCYLDNDLDFKRGHVTIAAPRGGELYKLAEIPASECCAASIKRGCVGTFVSGGPVSGGTRGGG